jgi:hypothetical protein
MSEHVSYRAEDQIPSGFMDGQIVKLQNPIFRETQYRGVADVTVVAFCVDLVYDNKPYPQEYIIGATTAWLIRENGQHVVSALKRPGFDPNSNCGLFFKGLQNAGFDMKKLEDGVQVLDGLVVRIGTAVKKSKDKVFTVAVPAEIIDDSASGSGAESVDIESVTTECILTAIHNNDNAIPKKNLLVAVVKLLQEQGVKNTGACATFILSDDWLKKGPWKYEGGILSI